MTNATDSETDSDLDQGITAALTASIDESEAREALGYKTSRAMVIIMPLSSGRFAVYSRGFELERIVDEVPTSNELRQVSQEFYTRLFGQSRIGAEAAFYGEPGDRAFAHDLKLQRIPPKKPRALAVEIEL